MATPDIAPSEITVFARTNFRNTLKPFGIKTDDRRRHMYVIGKTGMGKSTLLENMIIQDIRAGRGLALVDPHGDTVEKVIRFVPSYRINDVVYFNPADVEWPIAFNILEAIDPTHRHLVASGLIAVFKKIWADSWGPRLEHILRNTILALIEYPGSTLLGVTRMLVDKEYRKKVVDNLSDPIVKAFWRDEFALFNEKFRSEAVSPIQNKIGQFLSSSIIRNIVGQPKSTIDMREIMDSGKVLLLNLAKGRIGEDNAALMGAMMITKMQLAAMSRIDIPEFERRDFFLYVDEFQNFATESFANILSEARKYRLDLIIAHQYIEQLDETVRAAVFGNVGTIVTFRVGAADAEFLAKEYMPIFTETDLVNLTKFDMYLKLMIDGVASEPFSATGLPPINNPDDLEDTVIRVSRERYSKEKKIVEEKISRWSGMEEEATGQLSAGDQESGQTEYRQRSTRAESRPAKPDPKEFTVLERQPVVTVAEPAAISLSQAIPTPPASIPSRDGRPDRREPSSARSSRPAGPRPARDASGSARVSSNRPSRDRSRSAEPRPTNRPAAAAPARRPASTDNQPSGSLSAILDQAPTPPPEPALSVASTPPVATAASVSSQPASPPTISLSSLAPRPAAPTGGPVNHQPEAGQLVKSSEKLPPRSAPSRGPITPPAPTVIRQPVQTPDQTTAPASLSLSSLAPHPATPSNPLATTSGPQPRPPAPSIPAPPVAARPVAVPQPRPTTVPPMSSPLNSRSPLLAPTVVPPGQVIKFS